MFEASLMHLPVFAAAMGNFSVANPSTNQCTYVRLSAFMRGQLSFIIPHVGTQQFAGGASMAAPASAAATAQGIGHVHTHSPHLPASAGANTVRNRQRRQQQKFQKLQQRDQVAMLTAQLSALHPLSVYPQVQYGFQQQAHGAAVQ